MSDAILLPIEDYHSHPAIGSSFLKLLKSTTPLHCWAAYIDPEREKVDKKAWRIGRAWHTAVFEPSEFDSRYAANHDENANTNKAKLLRECLENHDLGEKLVPIPDTISKTSKEGKELYSGYEADGLRPVSQSDYDFVKDWYFKLYGKEILSADTIADILNMASYVMTFPASQVIFSQLAKHGRSEVSFFDTDPLTGVQLKIRPDYMLEPCKMFPDGLIIDGKTTVDASGEGFARQVWNLDYYIQASLYTKVFQRVYRTKGRPRFLWLAQEKSHPFAGRYYAAGSDLIEYGDKIISRLLPKIRDCQETGVWHSYPDGIGDLQMPAFAQKVIEETV